MLDQATRTAILRLHEEGHGARAIAQAVGASRNAVRRVLRDQTDVVPLFAREERAKPQRDEIIELVARMKGNLARVHEELVAGGLSLSYPALTAFCRRHGIGHEPPQPVGRYEFAPGQEMQHDTSPHDVTIAGVRRRVQTASAVLCYSRMLFIQIYPRFDRFTCKVFLTDALRYFDGVTKVCMIDNTHVVVAAGTGAIMVPAPEMASFAERFGFHFQAHEKGDANRSAHVERQFDHVERNFLVGREFADWQDLNVQARAWCDKVNAAFKRHLHASPRELYAVERTHLRHLPVWVPEPYLLHHRVVDLGGFVNVHQNRYSAPWTLIGRRVEVRETRDEIQIFDGPRLVGAHKKEGDARDVRVAAPEHRPPRGHGEHARRTSPPEEERLRLLGQGDYVDGLRRHRRGLRDLRRLLRMFDEYPREPLLQALRTAEQYGLYDLDRVERLLLRSLARDYFFVEPAPPDDPEDTDDG